nr:hypothetical protein [Actinomycetota bacterium]
MPVVAAVAAVPMAAASAKDAVLSAQVGGTIIANDTAKTATGTLNGGVSITNVKGGPWQTGVLTGKYVGTGIWDTFAIVKPGGQPFVQGETITSGGLVWTVTAVVIDADGTWEVDFAAPSQSVSADTTFLLPPAEFSGTWSGTPTARKPVQGTVSVGAANVNNGTTVSGAVSHP